ncbi:hypothetical protein MIR68_004411 [Amoeboaphelidium protococcarum]|nr:hypothetical protein MIR68_004411 [Amoeboaphelidium protococcarum]
MSLLTQTQQKELNLAICEYLENQLSLPQVGKQFREATGIGLDEEIQPQYRQLLERKWTSTLRLQRKVLELEEVLRSLPPSMQQQIEMQNSNNNGSALSSSLTPSKNTTNPLQKLPKSQSQLTLNTKSSVNCVAVDYQHSIIACGNEDCMIRLFDLDNDGELIQTLKGHTKGVTSLTFNQDTILNQSFAIVSDDNTQSRQQKSRFLISGSADTTIKIWDQTNNNNNPWSCVRTLYGHDHSVSRVLMCPQQQQQLNGQLLYSCSRDKTIRKWNISTGFCLNVFRLPQKQSDQWIRCMDVSADGKLLVCGGNDQTLTLIDTTDGQVKFDEMYGHSNVVEDVQFIPHTANSLIHELIASGGQQFRSNDKDNEDSADKQQFIVSASRDKLIKIWSIYQSGGECVYTIKGHENWVRALDFYTVSVKESSVSSKQVLIPYLVSASDDKTVRFWDLKNGRCVRVINEHLQFVTCLAHCPFYPVNRQLMFNQTDRRRQSSSNGTSMDLISNYLVSGSADQTLKVWK